MNKEWKLANGLAKSSKSQLTFVLKTSKDFKEKEIKEIEKKGINTRVEARHQRRGRDAHGGPLWGQTPEM